MTADRSDQLAEHYDTTEDAWSESEPVEIEVKRPLDKIVPIRLPSDLWETLRQEANAKGIGPTTLARMWLIAHINEERSAQSARS